MALKPLIIPFQTEVYVTNNKNTPDKNCVRITPDYSKAAVTSYLGGNMQPPPFTYQPPLQAGIHLHFILPGCFRRAEQKQDGENGGYGWEYAPVPDRWIVTRMVLDRGKKVIYRNFIVESNYTGLDNCKSVAIPFLEDSETPYRYLGRCFEYGKGQGDEGSYLENLTAMGAGDPYFSAYYPSCHSVFGFYDNMSDVKIGSDLAYFVTGYFSDQARDPFYSMQKQEFQERLKNMGLVVEDESFYTDSSVLFSEVWGIRWKGYGAEYPSGRPEGEINCGIGNTSAEVISAIIGKKAEKRDERDWERLFDVLQYEMADALDDLDGIALAEDEIHAKTFAASDGGNIWTLRYRDKGVQDLPKQAGLLLAELNAAQRSYNRKLEETAYWKDAAYADWYSYMLLYEGDETGTLEREKMKREIFRICEQVLPQIQKEAQQLHHMTTEKLSELKKHLRQTGIEVEQTKDEAFWEPEDPVLLLYGNGIKRSYAFADEGELICQTSALGELSDGYITLHKQELAAYVGNIPEIIREFPELFIQAMCLNDQVVSMIKEQEGLPGLACDKSGISRLAARKYEQSWLTLLIEWKLGFYPSRTLSLDEDDSMKFWYFGGTDYENNCPRREALLMYSGRSMITPHSLYRFRYVAEKYLSQSGDISEEIIEALKRVEQLPVLSQNMDGLNQQILSRMQTLQAPIMGNDSDRELTDVLLRYLPAEKLAVNSSTPFFPLRAGHIHLETVNIVNSFGRVQNAFSSKMNPIYSEVMGEYEDTENHVRYGMMRPRILQGARLRVDFMMADDERLLAERTPETSPICGILLPELLNRRLALYSPKGEYYGCVKTIYRGGKPFAAWMSPPDQIEVPFEAIKFDYERFREMIAYLLEDSERGGTAFHQLMSLIQEQLSCAVPSGISLGEELPYIWGRPLAVSLCLAGIECRGGLAFSQLKEEFGRGNTLSVEKIGFPLMVGDRSRAISGVVGYYEGSDYTGLYPAYGSEKSSVWEVEGRAASGYVRFGENTVLCAEGGKKVLTILSEIGNILYFQTGILPMVKKTLDAVYTGCVSEIKLCFEADSVMCALKAPMLPVPVADSGEEWYFEYIERQPGKVIVQKERILGNTDTFHEETEIVCDGYLTLEKKKG